MAKVAYEFNPEAIAGNAPEPETPKEETPKDPQPEQPKQEEEQAQPEAEPEQEDSKQEQPEQPKQEKELDDKQLLESLKRRGFKGDSLDQLLADKEEKAQTPKRAVDEDTQKFLDYQERTGRGLKDWQELNRDWKKADPIEVAKDRIKRESGGADLSEQDLNYLLEEELGFDPTDEDLTDGEKAKFKKFYGSHLNTLKTEQQKYNEPAEGSEAKKTEKDAQPDGGKKVQLSNGQEVDAEAYEKDRQKYLADRDAALQTIKQDEFKLTYDGKDGKKELSFDYKYTDEDLHSMKSITEDVGGILSNYQAKDGNFDHATFNRDLLWTKPEFRNKAISALLSRARNEVLSEVTGKRKNVNFDSPNEPPKSKGKGYAEPGSGDAGSGPRVKFGLPT